jgi:hypothetical protein
MATRVRLDLDPETFGRLIETAVTEQRPTDLQAEVILRRALGTWAEPRIGYVASAPAPASPPPAPTEREAEHVPG